MQTETHIPRLMCFALARKPCVLARPVVVAWGAVLTLRQVGTRYTSATKSVTASVKRVLFAFASLFPKVRPPGSLSEAASILLVA